jgi:UDP-galactopyranose mutase
MMSVLIVGAGFSGAVVANILANNGYKVDIVDQRMHLAGNCHTERDAETGIMVHKYGPHIFHTDNKTVWDFMCRFTTFMPYINRVKTTFNDRVYSLPVNLHTINQFFGKCFNPAEAKSFIESIAIKSIKEPKSFEEQALKFIGKELYEAFFKGYTKKQWGIEPSELPASILKRLPVRFNYDDNYFNHTFQGIPDDGYTSIIEKMLDHHNISITLGDKIMNGEADSYDHTFYSGPIDEWFEYSNGHLGYRTLDFEEIRSAEDFQGCAVMNYGSTEVAHTRISEHKYFTPWESHSKTIAFREYSRSCEPGDTPYYPIRLLGEQELLKKYVDKAKKLKKISFLGRLGTYRYLDMDTTVAEALEAANIFLRCIKDGSKIPVFFVKPL